MSDPHRRRFLERLAEGDATVSELASLVDVSLPAVSRHIRRLAEAGLVRRTKRGRVTWCHLCPEALDEAMGWLARTRGQWQDRLDRLTTLLEEEP